MSALEVAATGAAADAIAAHVPTLVADRVASRLFHQDATLWGAAAEEESAKRLSWTGLPRSSRHLVGEIAALKAELSETGYDRVVLCGMGGSSLAPEVICATAGVPIVVLDSSDPDVVRRTLTDLERTVVVGSQDVGHRLGVVEEGLDVGPGEAAGHEAERGQGGVAAADGGVGVDDAEAP